MGCSTPGLPVHDHLPELAQTHVHRVGDDIQPSLLNPMDCSMPGFPVPHNLPELTETHVHRVGDAIQPSHPLSSPAPPTLSLSQHQGLFK